MKFLALLTFVAVASMASAVPSDDLHKELMEFVELIPVEDMRAVAKKYIDTDGKVQQAVAYLKGEELANLVADVREHPTWKKLREYMTDAGLNVEAIIQFINDLIIPDGVNVVPKNQVVSDMRSIIDELVALLPLENLLDLVSDKLTNNPDFQAFWEKITHNDAYLMIEKIRALPEVQRITQVLREFGIDIDKVLNLVYTLFGWDDDKAV